MSKSLRALLALSLLLAGLTTTPVTQVASAEPECPSPIAPAGSGTDADPYRIATPEHLMWLSDASDAWTKSFIQVADIDFGGTLQQCDSGAGWMPIGDGTTAFSGIYDGQGHSITDLFVNRSTRQVGFFGYTVGAEIRHLHLIDVNVKGSSQVGALIGTNRRGSAAKMTMVYDVSVTVSNTDTETPPCTENMPCVRSTSTGAADTGGLVGYVYNITITFARADVDVEAKGRNVGGLVGDGTSGTTIERSWATGSVTSTGTQGQVGGLAGLFRGTGIYDSYAMGDVTRGDVKRVDEDEDKPLVASGAGGLIGRVGSTSNTERSYATGSVNGPECPEDCGFLIGVGDGTRKGLPLEESGEESRQDVVRAAALHEKNPWEITTVWSLPEGSGFPTLRTPPGRPVVSELSRDGGVITVTIGSVAENGLQVTAYEVRTHDSYSRATPETPLANPFNVTLDATTSGPALLRIRAKSGAEVGPSVSFWRPSTPIGLTTTTLAPDQIGLSWSASADTGTPGHVNVPPLDYEVEFGTDDAFSAGPVTGDTTATVTGLDGATEYSVRIAARNVIGVGSPTSLIAALTTPAPNLDLSVIPGDGSARISWEISNPPAAVTGVTVSHDGISACSVAPSVTSCDVSGLSNGSPAELVVAANFEDGSTVSATTEATASVIMLDNGVFAFGGSAFNSGNPPSLVSSVNNSGNLLQPFYWNGTAERWEKLTFSSLPLDIAIGSGTSGGNWTLATVVENPVLRDRTVIPTAFTCADRPAATGDGSSAGAYASTTCPSPGSPRVGYGTVESSGIADINGQDVRIRSTYQLDANAQFIKVTTSIENLDASAAPNVNLWVGTRDDWVGSDNSSPNPRADAPRKEKGRLAGTTFEQIATKEEPANALRITSRDGTVLFFSSTPNTNMSVQRCCSFGNAYNADPIDSNEDVTNDGSYALYLNLGDLAPSGAFGSSQQLVWFYAGGPVSDAGSLASTVSSAAPPAAPVATPGNQRVKVDWATPSNVVDPSGFKIRTTNTVTGGTTVTEITPGSTQSAIIESLTNDVRYLFEVAAVTGTDTGPFSTPSEAIPGRPIGVLPSISPAGVAPLPLPGDTLIGEPREADWRWLEGASDLTTALRWERDASPIAGASATTYTIPVDTAPSGFRIIVTRTSTLSGLSASVASGTVPLGDLRPTSLSLSSGTLVPDFGRDVATYTAEVSNATTSIRITPTAQTPTSLAVNDASVNSGSQSGNIPLEVGQNIITLTTSLGETTREVTIVVTRLATTPAAPISPQATAGPASATLTWTSESDGGSAITGASIQHSADSGSMWVDSTTEACAPATASCRRVTGLTPGADFLFRVRLLNAVGPGDYSVATALAVTPTVPALPVAPTPVIAPPLPPGPVLTAGAAPRPSVTPTARVGGTEVAIASTPAGTTRQVGTATVSTATILQVGGIALAVDVTGAGEVRTNAGAAPQISVARDSVARTSGGGMLPGTQLQVWLPLAGGDTVRPVTSLPVAADGTFTGELPFDGRSDRESDGRPLPIGTHVLQLVGVDAQGEVTVIEQTVRIEQPAPAPKPDRGAGAPPTLTPGASIATNAGVPETVTVVPVPDVRQARVEGSGWNMAVDIPSADGRVSAAEGGGALIELVEDDVAEVSGDGFLGGTRADVWLFSTPTLLGSVTINADGTFSGEVPVEGIATGEHTLQLQGVGRDGYVRAANLGVVVVPRGVDEPAAAPEAAPEPEVAPEPAPQPDGRVEVVTASGDGSGSGNPLVWIALIVAAAGSGWRFLLGRRRRDDEDEDVLAAGDTTG